MTTSWISSPPLTTWRSTVSPGTTSTGSGRNIQSLRTMLTSRGEPDEPGTIGGVGGAGPASQPATARRRSAGREAEDEPRADEGEDGRARAESRPEPSRARARTAAPSARRDACPHFLTRARTAPHSAASLAPARSARQPSPRDPVPGPDRGTAWRCRPPTAVPAPPMPIAGSGRGRARDPARGPDEGVLDRHRERAPRGAPASRRSRASGSSRSTTSTSTSATASSSRCSARPARARRRRSG